MVSLIRRLTGAILHTPRWHTQPARTASTPLVTIRSATLLAALALGSAACAQSAETPAKTDVDRYGAAIDSDSGPAKPRRQTVPCKVIRITDGDGIVCNRIGRVRLIGIDAPELNQRPFGPQAAAALGRMIPVGAEIQLEPDVEGRDRYGRQLAYLWSGSRMVNWRMVHDGWAVLLTHPPNVQYAETFARAERLAREGSRGLWGVGGFECRPAEHRARRCD